MSRYNKWRAASLLGLLCALVLASKQAAPQGRRDAAAVSSPSRHARPATATATQGSSTDGDDTRLAEDARRKAALLRRELGDECSVVVHPPFVIAADMTKEQLNGWYRDTIAPAAEALANQYFDAPPTQPITVLLFTAEESYNRFAKQLFADENVSVYGYYKPERRTLVMNIATGGGTLVHELTHALMAFDFPSVPDWFNEGLASLYEQCRFGEKNNRRTIEGLVNWRLPKLQQAIRAESLGALEALMTADDFRGRNVGLNYAQARYFCLYLQEQRLLTQYYRAFRTNRQDDPRGLKSARRVLGTKWNTIDKDFQDWVLTLER